MVILAILLLPGLHAVYGDPLSPVDMTNVDSPDPVASGAEITYTITMTNTGGSRVDSVVFSDQLNGVGGIGVPPQLQITSTRGSCTQTTTLVQCSAGTIEGRGTWIVTIRGIVTASNGTVINNTATVAGTRSAQNFNTTVTANTQVVGGSGSPKPDLSITKVGPTTVQASTAMVYTLTVNNLGTANATGIRVMDTVPAGVSITSASGTSLFVCSVAGQTVTCDGGQVNQGSNGTVTINAVAPAALGPITNTAVVDPDNAIEEGNELNNTSAIVNTEVTSSGAPPALLIQHTDDPLVLAGAGKDPTVPGALLTYKTLVTNPSTLRADDVEIVVGTQGLVASSISVSQLISNGTVGNNGGCFVLASETRCRARTLQAGGTILMTITGSVIASAGSTIISTAAVTGNLRNTGVSSQDTELTTVKPEIDLTITKSDSPDPVCASSWAGTVPVPLLAPPVCLGGLTYTYVLGNSGIKEATNVTIRDPLPAGTVLDSFTAPAPFACSVSPANVFTCTGGTIGPETTVTITATLVAPPGTGTIQNIVTIDPNNAIFEADETNNTALATTVVNTGIDLVILKVDSAPGFPTIATSGTQTYTITVDNVGTQNATNIHVRDTLPANTRFRSATGDNGLTCSHSNGVVDCVGGSILGTNSEFHVPGAPGDDTATIVIRVFAQPTVGTMHNEVRVDPLNTIAEVNEGNNFEFEDTDVTSGGESIGAFNQFTIEKTRVSPADPVARNAKVTYSIVVKNDGSDPALGITVRDFLPAGARYIEATGTNEFNCSQVGNHIDCVGGKLDAHNGSATITVTAFAPDTPGTYTNQAIIDPDNAIPEGNEFDNQDSVQIVVQNGGNGPFYELSIVKTQTSPLPPTDTARNAEVTYTIVVTNTGSDPVTGIHVRDMLPAGSRYIQASAPPASQFLCTHSAGIVECLGGKLSGSAGGSNQATITVKMFAPDTPGLYTNQALVDPDNTIPEGNEENNQSSFDTTVTNGGQGAFNDLTITKMGPPTVKPGDLITWTINVNNLGLAPAQNVSVRDVLPAGTTFVSAIDSGAGASFTCAHNGGVVDCIASTIDAGGARTITIKATAPQQNIVLTNTVLVDPGNTVPEGNESNNTAFAVTSVSAQINLTVTKSGPTTATQSTATEYSIAVTNNAVGDGQFATGVVMHDALPVGLIPLAVDAGTGNNWNCEISQNPVNLVQCLGDLAIGETVTVKITVFITAESGRSLDNIACVDPNNTITESNELDNCSEVSTVITPAEPKRPDLLVSKQVDKLSTTPGDDLTYTVTVSNTGDVKAMGPLTVTDSLSNQVTFTNVTATNGWTCSESAGTVSCTEGLDASMVPKGLEVGESAQITILVHVKETANVAILNTAHANTAFPACPPMDSCEPETNVANNDSSVTSSIGSSGFDLAIGAVTDVPDSVAPGQGLEYTVTALNGGTATATGVKIRLNLPTAGVMHLGTSGSNGFTCDAPGSTTIDCTGNLPGGGTTTITVQFVVNTAGAPTAVSLTATIDPLDAFNETDEGNNTETEPTTISGATCSACVDLVAAQLTASPEPVAGGGTVTYKFLVVNVGDLPSALTPGQKLLQLSASSIGGSIGAVSITSPDPVLFPCTTTFVVPPATPTSGTCEGNLAPGQGITITFTVPSVTGTGVQVTGTADPGPNQPEFFETNNSATQTVAVAP